VRDARYGALAGERERRGVVHQIHETSTNCRCPSPSCDHEFDDLHPGGDADMAAPAPTPAVQDLFDRDEPWTEEDFLALPEDRRIELLDGELLLMASPNRRHQRVSFRVAAALDAACTAGFEVYEAINVRVAPGRIFIPDVVVVTNPGLDLEVTDATDVAMVVEIVSPSSVVTDRAIKPQLYAAAGIPCYVRIERGAVPSAIAYRLRDGRYAEAIRAEPGGWLRLREPFTVEVDLAKLVLPPAPES